MHAGLLGDVNATCAPVIAPLRREQAHDALIPDAPRQFFAWVPSFLCPTLGDTTPLSWEEKPGVTKRCAKCGKAKEATAVSPESFAFSFFHNWCRACHALFADALRLRVWHHA